MENIIRDFLYIIITGCSVAVAKHIVSLINKKINEVQVNTEIKEYDKLNQYIDSAQKVISNAVLTVTQTYVESLKKSGNFTAEAQAEAKNRAVTIAKELITEECKNAIVVVYADFDAYLDSTIESLVKKNKVVDTTN